MQQAGCSLEEGMVHCTQVDHRETGLQCRQLHFVMTAVSLAAVLTNTCSLVLPHCLQVGAKTITLRQAVLVSVRDQGCWHSLAFVAAWVLPYTT